MGTLHVTYIHIGFKSNVYSSPSLFISRCLCDNETEQQTCPQISVWLSSLLSTSPAQSEPRLRQIAVRDSVRAPTSIAPCSLSGTASMLSLKARSVGTVVLIVGLSTVSSSDDKELLRVCVCPPLLPCRY